jgi:hypothetical protein
MRVRRPFVFRESKGFETQQLPVEFGEHELSIRVKAPAPSSNQAK